MNGRPGTALGGVLATLAASCALLPLVNTASWLAQAAVLVTVQAAAGVLLRRAGSPRAATVAGQAVAALLMLTVLCAGGRAVAGFLPGPEVFAEFGRLLGKGAADVGRFTSPAPLTDGIRMLLVGGVVLIGLVVDVVAVTLRSAAPAGLPLLALYSVASGVGDGGALRGVWFLCGAAGYLLLLLTDGHGRHLRWGRVFPERGLPSAVRPWGGAGAGIGAVVLAVAVAVPAALPALDGGLVRGGDDARRDEDGGTLSAVNPLVALQDSLNQPGNRTALTYTTDADRVGEMYLRVVALDQFEGSAWRPSEREIDTVPRQLPTPDGLSPGVRTRPVNTRVRSADWYAQDWLPLPYPAEQVRVGGRWRFEPEGRSLVGEQGQTTRGATYAVRSLQVLPTARQLREAPEPPEDLRQEYTKVPHSLPSVVRRTALRVTRGAHTDYGRAVKLQRWFTSDAFRYDTTVRSGSGSAAVANFLEQKEGFCVHFAFSMAAMARTLDVPARVAVGFTPGTAQADGSMAVGLQDAHAWPELYFEGVGWTRFEPTPTRGTSPAYTRPAVPEPDLPDPREEPDGNRDAAPDQEPGRQNPCDGADPAGRPECPATGGDGATTAGTVALVALPAALLVAVLLALPVCRRTRLRARRIGPRASDPLGPWRELRDSARDMGIPTPESLTPRTAAARITESAGLGPEAGAATRRVALGVERSLYAPGGQRGPDPAAGEDVRRVRAELWRTAPWRVRLRSVFLPRSLTSRRTKTPKDDGGPATG